MKTVKYLAIAAICAAVIAAFVAPRKAAPPSGQAPQLEGAVPQAPAASRAPQPDGAAHSTPLASHAFQHDGVAPSTPETSPVSQLEGTALSTPSASHAFQHDGAALQTAPGGSAAPVLSVYRWGTGGCEKGLYDQWEQWVGAPVWAEDFMPKESWDKIEGEAWQLGVWGKWRTMAPGRRLVLSVPMLVGPWNHSGPKTGPHAGEPVSLAKGAAGEYDEHFAALGRNLVKWGLADTIVRLGWEFNGGWYTYRAESEAEARDFAAFFRRAVDAMRRADGQQFLFCWNPSMEPHWNYPVDAAWPGDDVVDIIGLDVYDQSWKPDTYPIPVNATPEERLERQKRAWQTKTACKKAFGLPWWPEFACRHGGKPLAVCEWGVCHREDGHGGGDDPFFIEQMADFMLDPANNVMFHCYFDVGAPDGDHLLIPDGKNATKFPESSRAFHKRFAHEGAAYIPPAFKRLW